MRSVTAPTRARRSIASHTPRFIPRAMAPTGAEPPFRSSHSRISAPVPPGTLRAAATSTTTSELPHSPAGSAALSARPIGAP